MANGAANITIRLAARLMRYTLPFGRVRLLSTLAHTVAGSYSNMAKTKSTAKGASKPGKPAAKPALKKAKAAPAKKGSGTRTAPAKKKPVRPAGKPVAKKAAKPAKPAAKPAKKAAVGAVKKAGPAKRIAPKAVPEGPVQKATLAKPTSAAKKPVTAKPAVKPRPVEQKPSPATRSVAPEPVAVKQPPPPKPAPAKKRPAKERVVMEFYLNSSPNALYELLSTPSGFSEWYCQDVDVRGDQYTFIWDGEREETTLIGRKLGEVIRFRRNDDDDPEAFFEFRVRIDAMTNEVCLVVTDHAWPQEIQEMRNLWASQIETLGRVLGA